LAVWRSPQFRGLKFLFFVGPNAGDAYSNCERIEGRTERLYERALKAHLPHTVRQTVARQHAEIAADRIELRRRSFGG